MTQFTKRTGWIVCSLLVIGLVAVLSPRVDQSNLGDTVSNNSSQIDTRLSTQLSRVPILDATPVRPVSGFSEQPDDAGWEPENNVGIAFPDGEVIPLTFRPHPTNHWEKPLLLADGYDELANAALDGDPFAASELAEALARCSQVHAKTRPELNAVIDQLQQTHQYPTRWIVPGTWEDTTVMSGADPTDATIAMIRGNFEFCLGIMDKQLVTYVDWFQLASANGHPRAGYEIGKHGASYGLDRDTSEQLLLQSWNNGNTLAAAELGNFYGSRNSSAPPNHELEYAYTYVYAELAKADSSIPAGVGFAQSAREALDETATKLSPHEVLQAQALAKKILKQNKNNCCYGIFNFEDK